MGDDSVLGLIGAKSRKPRLWCSFTRQGDDVYGEVRYLSRLEKYDGILTPSLGWPHARRFAMVRKQRFDNLFDAACYVLSPNNRRGIYG